ncbi:MAG: penicillin-binding protein 2 [Clostridiales bacterium]|nr:penicillin-binding protein 2 [Clostridiales bacterium]
MQKKLLVLFFFVLLAFAGLSARLILINKENGESYKKQILSQQQYESKTLPYRRGDIMDSKGSKLAVSEKVYNVVLDTYLMTEKEEYIEPTISALTKCFGVNGAEIRTYIAENPTSRYNVLARRLSYEEVSPFLEMEADKENGGANIQGIWFEEEYKRVYPNGELASTILGFMGKDNGSYGLEEYYNDILNGTNGREYGYLNDDATLERSIKPAVDGNSLVLTVDANIQSIVERCLKEYREEYTNSVVDGPGYKNAGCIIMDIHTGNILAMADSSGYDPNNAQNPEKLIGQFKIDVSGNGTDELITQEVLSDMVSDNDLLYQNLNNMWKNFCISNTYEPGSVAKPFTVATAIESGAITGNETYNCGGFLEIGGHKIKCHNTLGDGTLTVGEAIERSCNVAMMHIGEATGVNTFTKYQSNYNFGLKTNVDMAGEARTAGLLYDASNMGPAELATSTFGQGFNVTMIQMITAFSSLINGGYYYEPHIVSKIVNADGATVKNIEPRVLKQTISRSTSDKIVEYCNLVVTGEHGTGKTARPAGYMIGGKTGTAETLPRGNHKYVVSFMGYAPADDPQIAIYVVVQEANGDYHGDAKHATRIVRSILTEVLPYLNISMTEELSEEEKQELAEHKLEVTGAAKNVSDNEADENADENAEGSAGDESDGDDSSAGTENGEGNLQEPEITIDPETGYAVNFEGELVDPATGVPVEPSGTGLDGL